MKFVGKLLAWPLLGLVWLYRYAISPLVGANCRFEPTCSHYAEQALTTHGLWKGAILMGWRLLRCNPAGEYGYDPVPPGDWREAFRRRLIARTNRQLESRESVPPASDAPSA